VPSSTSCSLNLSSPTISGNPRKKVARYSHKGGGRPSSFFRKGGRLEGKGGGGVFFSTAKKSPSSSTKSSRRENELQNEEKGTADPPQSRHISRKIEAPLVKKGSSHSLGSSWRGFFTVSSLHSRPSRDRSLFGLLSACLH